MSANAAHQHRLRINRVAARLSRRGLRLVDVGSSRFIVRDRAGEPVAGPLDLEGVEAMVR
jgi:hypothetical protein